MRRVAIIGGIGYLGTNLAYYHNKIGDYVYILSRLKTISKRPNIFKLLIYLGSEIYLFNELCSKESLSILKDVNPEIAYIVTGRLYGGYDETYVSNTLIPLKYINYLEKNYVDCLNIYVSHAFNYDDLNRYNLKLNNSVITIYFDKSVSLSSPRHLLNKSYYITKYLAEKTISRRFKNTYIYRPGLLIGMFPTHLEWRILNLLTDAGLPIPLLNKLPVTITFDIAKVTDFIYKKNEELPRILLVCKYAPTIKELINLLRSSKSFIKTGEKDGFHSSLGVRIPTSMLLDINEYVYPYSLINYGFDEWTPVKEGLEILAKTIRI